MTKLQDYEFAVYRFLNGPMLEYTCLLELFNPPAVVRYLSRRRQSRA